MAMVVAGNVSFCLKLAEAGKEGAQALLEQRHEEEKQQEEEEEQEPPESPGSFFSSTSCSTSDEDSSSQEEEGTGFHQASEDTKSLPRDLLNEKVANLVHLMILKYQQKEPITKAEMLKVVIKRDNKQFLVTFEKASKCLEVISGIDVKEVDPKTHCYILFNSLGLTHDKIVSDDQNMPTSGLLIIILGVIFIEGNCVPEENIWNFLNMIGIKAGRKHFIYGEPRKLITRNWVQENSLEYRMVSNSDPSWYEFRWGPRSYAETSKLKVLEFLAKIKWIDLISFSDCYEEALRDEEERAGARNNSMDSNTAMFIVQHLLVIPDPTEETVFEEGSQVSK
ncbi:PREDICTED: melanoma-associated antigen B16-like [Capra hircus]|uniref:melanoma-associated antigen B16-like n=1 Tax=Capra hircus TaxID=9925 RepID=UPI000846D4DC|nr:PREDICTED: melanoma-associated antigen B16-like [Capra hircus]